MRQYECRCLKCGQTHQFWFDSESYPDVGAVFLRECHSCGKTTEFTRVLTRKAAAEIREKQRENALRKAIADKCAECGFRWRFLYQSVIITTNLSDWCFDYHQSRITLYHESTCKVSFETGNYAKAHKQFENRKMSPLEVIDYISKHDAWKASRQSGDSNTD